MNVRDYLARRVAAAAEVKPPRGTCWTCRQVESFCLCGAIKPFATDVHFVILIHPIEVRRRIATGRLAHLCLTNSTLIEGIDFSENAAVRAILTAPRSRCVVLYPDRRALNLSTMSETESRELTGDGRRLVIFVIDGTWATAGRMRRSRGLIDLPTVSFNPDRRSRFRVRQQPTPECLSTIEAIHHTIDLLRPSDRAHDHLLEVFNQLVEGQLSFIQARRAEGRLRLRERGAPGSAPNARPR